MHLHLAMPNSDGQIDFYIVKLEIPFFFQHRPVLIFVCLAVCMAPQMPSRIVYLAFFLSVGTKTNKLPVAVFLFCREQNKPIGGFEIQLIKKRPPNSYFEVLTVE